MRQRKQEVNSPVDNGDSGEKFVDKEAFFEEIEESKSTTFLNEIVTFINDKASSQFQISFIKTSIQTIASIIYSFLPFLLLIYFYNIYKSPQEDFLYYPDFHSNIQQSGTDEISGLNVEFYDLKDYESSFNGWQNEERILFLVPLRDAAPHLPMFFSHMRNLTYPHHLIDMSFLVSDTSDSTVEDLQKYMTEIQSDKAMRFGRIEIFLKDFGQIVGQSFSDRHGFAAQGPRRKKMAIARNWLLFTALRPDHSWVYWRDIDVETCPATILEDLMHHNKDVIVPNIWRPLPDWLGYEQAYDLNSWQESEGGIELADRLDEDAVIVEGYPEYATWRPHLAYLRDPYGDPEVEIELDGIGGVSILSKASVFRRGAMFPAFSYKKHAETEAFGKLCKTMGFEVFGLPHYVIWHIYEPSTDDLKHMEWLANEEIRQKEHLKIKVVFDKAWKEGFEDVHEQWEQEKFDIFKNTDLSSLNLGKAHWDEVDEYLAEVDEDEYFAEQKTDEHFLMSFNMEKNKMFEQNVIDKLKNGPIKFGHSKNEFLFDNFHELANSKKKMKFKKFEKLSEDEEQIEGELTSDLDEYQLKGEYDLQSYQVVNGGKVKTSKTLNSRKKNQNQKDPSLLTKDKQLFDDLESSKNELDGEEEGGVEFKSQKSVEEAEAEARQRKLQKKKNLKNSKPRKVRKTLYEIDGQGKTLATVVQTVMVKPTFVPVVVEEDYTDDIDNDIDVDDDSFE